MGLASYEIVGSACEWRVSHDGKAENVYETKNRRLRPLQLRRHWLFAKGTRCA